MNSSYAIPALAALCHVFLFASPPSALAQPYFDAAWRAFDTASVSDFSSQYLTGLTAADLNGDSLPDAVASQGVRNGGLRVLLNEGDAAGSPAVFSEAVFYPTAYEAPQVIAADLDGDGDNDLAATNSSDFYEIGVFVAVLMNDGTGAFAPPAYFAAGPSGQHGPHGLVAADLDGDGDLDLAVANYGRLGKSGTVSVLMNHGDATFGAPTTYDAGEDELYNIDAGDVDGDGDLDLAVSCETGEVNVSVLSNDGTGAFDQFDVYNAGAPFNGAYSDVAFFDPDGDGDLDLAYTKNPGDGALYLLRNDGAGTFTPEMIPYGYNASVASALFVGDFNGDGYDDVAGPQLHEAGFVVHLADGAGGLLPPVMYAGSGNHQGNSVAGAAADLDLDGDLDVLTANRFVPLITAHENLGEGTFPRRPVYAGGWLPGTLDVGDVDGDGDLDAAISHTGYSAAEVTVFTGANDGTFAQSYETPESIYGFGRVADLNGDGLDDLLMGSGRGAPPYDFFTARSNGDGTFGPAVRWTLGSCGNAFPSAFDLDADGDLDVVVAEDRTCSGGVDNYLYIRLGNGDGTFQPVHTVESGGRTYFVAAGDFDEDGHLDLVESWTAAVFFGNGDGTFQPWQGLPGTPVLAGNLLVEDFDGDGHQDVAAYESNGTSQTWLAMFWGDGMGAFAKTTHGHHPLTFSDKWLTAGDVDGDGDRDLMANGMGDVLVFRYEGGRAFNFDGRYGIGQETDAPYYADFDGDGIGDLLAVVDRLPPGQASHGIAYIPGLDESTSAVESTENLPGISDSWMLSGPRPNPAGDRATFVLSLTRPERVTVALYDPLGRRVVVLHEGALQTGAHFMEFDGTGLPSGVYSMKAVGETFSATRRVILLR